MIDFADTLLVIHARHGFCKVVALDHVAALAGKELNLLSCLYSLGNGTHVKILGKFYRF